MRRGLNLLAKTSEALAFPYVLIEYQGKKLLISKSKLKSAVGLTWERVHDPETAILAKELGMEPRKYAVLYYISNTYTS